jgi:hypothetical protein
VAAEQGNAEMMRALIEAKADQSAKQHGTATAIELLLCNTTVKQGDVVHVLAVSGVDVNMRNAVR